MVFKIKTSANPNYLSEWFIYRFTGSACDGFQCKLVFQSAWHSLRQTIPLLQQFKGRGPCVVVKAACSWKVGDRGLVSRSGFQVSKKVIFLTRALVKI